VQLGADGQLLCQTGILCSCRQTVAKVCLQLEHGLFACEVFYFLDQLPAKHFLSSVQQSQLADLFGKKRQSELLMADWV